MKNNIKIFFTVLFLLIMGTVAGYAQNQNTTSKDLVISNKDTSDISYLSYVKDNAIQKENIKQKKPDLKPVSIVTGSVSGYYDVDAGVKQEWIVFNPMFLAPIGDRFFLQGSVEMEGTYTNGSQSSQQWDTKVEFLHMDYFANKNLTISGGAFLTPFGIYNERIDPRWIRNIQNEPYTHQGLYPESELGLMIRGGVRIIKNLDLSYTGYYSFQPSADFWVHAQRGVGGRIGLIHFPSGLEVGFSDYKTLLDYDKNNVWGLDLSFKYPGFPLGLKAEYVSAPQGQTIWTGANGKAYWVEANYRFTNFDNAPEFLRNFQVAARYEKYSITDALGVAQGDLKRFIAGVNYYLIDGLKLSFEFGKTYNPDNTTTNLITTGLVFRPVF